MTRVQPVRPLGVITLAIVVAAGGWLAARQAEQQPTFRAGVDLIELDVSVLDSDRRPVRDLVAADFSVVEDGRPQRIVAVSPVDVAAKDPVRSARMRFVSSDVAANDLGELIGDGRLVAIVFDDVNLPADDPDIVRAAREAARYVIDQLGPSDMAAVVHAHHSGRTQDFTSDRSRLLEAIDRFQPTTLEYVEPTPAGMGPSGGDMLQRWSPTLMRSACMRGEPAVPTLDTVASRMATTPGRRKALVFLSVGVPLSIGGGGSCGSQLSDVMRGVYRKAQRANVNIYAIDPAGLGGYQQYIALRNAQRDQNAAMGLRRRPANVRQLQDFMRTIAETTGGRAVINTNAIEASIDEILEEDRAYYIVGYESSRGAPDGRFRKIDVRVNRPGVSVRSRSGYWAPNADEVVARQPVGAPTSAAASMVGMSVSPGLSLRATAVPIARGQGAGSGARAVEVGVVLGVKFPPLRAAVDDTLTIIRNVYDADGNAGPPVRDVIPVRLEPNGGNEVRREVIQRLALEPGRYQIRLNTQSALLQSSGTVYADLEVPDFARGALTLSGLAVARTDGAAGSDVLASLLPVRPTSARDFAAGDPVEAFVRVYQGGTSELAPVTMVTEILDAADVSHFTSTQTLELSSFDASRGAAHRFPVPLTGLAPGPYLLSLTARLPGGRTARREVLLRVR